MTKMVTYEKDNKKKWEHQNDYRNDNIKLKKLITSQNYIRKCS
jgi:hypothetical protein